MNGIKLLFLPHCLKKEYFQKIKEAGEKKGYEVHIVNGSSIIKKILIGVESIGEIVGIACKDEIKLALEYTKPLADKGTIIKTVTLSKDGCKDTEVSLDKALEALS